MICVVQVKVGEAA